MGENRHAISLRDGTVTVNKIPVLEASKMSVKYKPEVGSYKSLRDKGTKNPLMQRLRQTSWQWQVLRIPHQRCQFWKLP